MSVGNIAKKACTATTIIEVNRPDAMPEFDGKTAQHNSYVFLVNVMDSISAWDRYGEFDFGKGISVSVNSTILEGLLASNE